MHVPRPGRLARLAAYLPTRADLACRCASRNAEQAVYKVRIPPDASQKLLLDRTHIDNTQHIHAESD